MAFQATTWRGRVLTRRDFIVTGAGGGLTILLGTRSVRGEPLHGPGNLRSAPIELAGNWGSMLPGSVLSVLRWARAACLTDIRLVSDRQPQGIRVDEHNSGSPAIWLHADQPELAWIIVDIGERDWSKLAYQFGHEFGHVLANSWQPTAKPSPPCQWLEEAMVEAFSLRGLAYLADNWRRNPPFANDNQFGEAIAAYRARIIQDYARLAGEQGSVRSFSDWYVNNRHDIEAQALGPYAQAASLTILAEYARDPGCVEALGALNRWPERSAVPLGQYLHLWEASCRTLHASPVLPIRLGELLRV